MEKDKIIGVIDLINDGIENGSLKVEEVHRQIADKPWEMAKKIPAFAQVSDTILGFQEQAIGITYNSVRKVSKMVTTQLKGLLSK